MRVVRVVSFHVAMSMAESVFVRFCLAVCACKMYVCVPPHATQCINLSRALNSKAFTL